MHVGPGSYNPPLVAEDSVGEIRRPAPGAFQVVVLAVATGGAVGFLELVPLLVAWSVDVPVQLSAHALWMTPLADVGLFALLGVALACLGRLWRRARSWALVMGALVGLGAFALLLMVEVVHDVAMLILATAVGVQASRMTAGRWTARWIRASPRLALAAPLLIGLLAGVTFAREGSMEAARRGLLPDAAPGAPNLVLLILDTVRAESLGLYGRDPSPSPNLDALASRGVTFQVAVAPAPWTLPTHASLFTGMWPGELGVGWSANLDDSEPTLAEVLGGQGYTSAGFVANLIYTGRQTGLARGFVRYEDRPVSVGQMVLSSSVGRAFAFNDGLRALLGYHELLNRKDAPRIRRDFLGWLDRERGRGDHRPYFAFLNFFDAHEPLFPSSEVLKGRRWGGFTHLGGLLLEGNSEKENKWLMSPEDVDLQVLAYEEAISRVDAEVGVIVRELEARGELERTVVVILADHGEQLGERGLFDHNNSVYAPAVRVPMMIVAPGRIPEGRRVSTTVSLRDVAATVLELVGSEVALPGVSLTGLWWAEGDGDRPEGGPEGAHVPTVSPGVSYLTLGYVDQPATPIARGGELHGYIEWPYQYVHNGDGTDEFYDLGASPGVCPDLAGRAEVDGLLRSMRARLYELVTGSPAPEGMPVTPAVAPGPVVP